MVFQPRPEPFVGVEFNLFIPDYRDTVEVLVHKDLRWHFDANHYCAPARWVGQELIAKADSRLIAKSLKESRRLVLKDVASRVTG